MKLTPRKIVFQVHLVAGLILASYLILASLTGIFLAFRTSIDVSLNPQLLRVAPGGSVLPLDTLAEAARKAVPGFPADYAIFSADPAAIVKFRFKTPRRTEVHVDPYTARVTGVRDPDDGFAYQIQRIHMYLFMGPSAEDVTATVALSVLVMIVSGLYLWMPKTWGKLREGLTLHRRLKGRAWNVNLHKVIGIYTAAFLFLVIVTGVPVADDFGWFRRLAYYRLTGSKPPEPPPKPAPAAPAAPRASFEQSWRSAHALIPRFQTARFNFPKPGSDLISVAIVAADAPHVNAQSLVYIDARTAAVLRFSPYEKESLGTRLLLWSLPVHQAEVGGLVGKLVMIAGAASIAGLTGTGVWLFYRRKIRPVRRAPGAPAPAPPQAQGRPAWKES